MYWEEIELEKTLGPGGEIRAVQRDKKNISKWEKLKKQLRRDKWMYLLLLPGIIMTFIFKYVPMYGAVIAFKDYNPMLGILESPWVGLDHFREFISSPNFTLLLSNTLKISIYGLLLGFFPPIILALSLNQIINKKIKQKIQLILYAPNFISVVIIVGMLFLFLSANGPINGLVEKVTGQPIMFVLFLYAFVGQWNSYFDAMIYIKDPDLQPLQLVLRNILIQNQPSQDMVGANTAMAEMKQIAELIKYATIVISSLPLIIMYPFFQKYFDKGVLVGSVKG